MEGGGADRSSKSKIEDRKQNEAFDVIKSEVLKNGNGIKDIKDELKQSEERLLQQLKLLHYSNPSKLAGSNQASPSVISEIL